MAHVMKHPKPATGHLCAHYDRSANNIGNENINPERTKENYNLAPERDMSQVDFIKQRCSEVKCHNRKDVNVMCSWVVTAPKELPQSDEQRFFKTAYDFLENRYGKSNVISAYVHMDEKQPHLHYAFVPVVTDQRKGIEKISAKEIITKKDLLTFHKDLEKYMSSAFGRDIGVLNDATKEGNKSIEQLKRESASEILEEARSRANEIIAEAKNNVAAELYKLQKLKEDTERITSETLNNADLEADKIKKDIEHSRETLKRLEDHINTFEGALGSAHEIEKMGKKSMVSGKVTFTVEEADNLKKQATAFWIMKSKAENYGAELVRTNEIAGRVRPLEDENRKLKKELKETLEDLNTIKDIIQSHPKLLEEYKEAEKQETKSKYNNQRQNDLRQDFKKTRNNYDER